MSTITNLIQQAEAITEERETNVIVSFISKMVELFPKIREAQPTIEKVVFGMGTWGFCGHASLFKIIYQTTAGTGILM